MNVTSYYIHPKFTNKYKCCIEKWCDIKSYSIVEVTENRILSLNEREFNQFIDRLLENGWQKTVDF